MLGIKKIAFVHPLGDYGISSYTHQLAESIGEKGIAVHVYTATSDVHQQLPNPIFYQRHEVLGSLLAKRRLRAASARHRANGAAASASAFGSSMVRVQPPRLEDRPNWFQTLRPWVLSAELALDIARRGAQAVWTQWPEMPEYGVGFWSICRKLGLTMVHTVHNVLPHEESAAGNRLHEEVYRRSDLLVVHSEAAKQDMARYFPSVQHKVVSAHRGLYRVYPRVPEARQTLRSRLGIADEQVAFLFTGLIRPYKNIDIVLEALNHPQCRDIVLIVTGREAGYEGYAAGGLDRTRERAVQLGVADRVKLFPGFLSMTEMAEFYEAGDAVILPYTKGYGSGILLLAMTFGKYVISTRTGGADEYLRHYSGGQILSDCTLPDVTASLISACSKLQQSPDRTFVLTDSELDWSTFANTTLRHVAAVRGKL